MFRCERMLLHGPSCFHRCRSRTDSMSTIPLLSTDRGVDLTEPRNEQSSSALAEWKLCLKTKGSHAAHSVCRMWTASVAGEHIWTQMSAHPLRKARTVVDRQQSQREHLYTYGDEYQRSPQHRHGTIAPIKNSDPLTGWGCLPGPSTLSGVLPKNKPFQRNHVQVVVVCPLKVLHSATQHGSTH
jgi:hypothetical protein